MCRGTNVAVVDSVWNHLNSLGGVSASNYATPGDKMGDILNNQAPLIDSSVDFVLIEGGANDVCTGYANATNLTPDCEFRRQTKELLTSIVTKAKPGAQIVVLSIPNIYNLWTLFHDNAIANFVWNYGSICQPLLANAASTDPADVNRRAYISSKVISLNKILQEECSAIPNQQCIFDQNLVYDWTYDVADVSSLDYFHPSCTSPTHGQGYAATLIWNFLSTTVGVTPSMTTGFMGLASVMEKLFGRGLRGSH